MTYLTAPSRYLNQCGPLIHEIRWQTQQLRAIPQHVPSLLICIISWPYSCLLVPRFAGANELRYQCCLTIDGISELKGIRHHGVVAHDNHPSNDRRHLTRLRLVLKASLKFTLDFTLTHCDAIWGHTSRSTLAQVMACCLMASSHYLNQCWLISKVQQHSF